MIQIISSITRLAWTPVPMEHTPLVQLAKAAQIIVQHVMKINVWPANPTILCIKRLVSINVQLEHFLNFLLALVTIFIKTLSFYLFYKDCPDNCDECDSSGCKACSNGYNLNKSGKCILIEKAESGGLSGILRSNQILIFLIYRGCYCWNYLRWYSNSCDGCLYSLFSEEKKIFLDFQTVFFSENIFSNIYKYSSGNSINRDSKFYIYKTLLQIVNL